MVSDAETAVTNSLNIAGRAHETLRYFEEQADRRTEEADAINRSRRRVASYTAPPAYFSCMCCTERVGIRHFQAPCQHVFCGTCLIRALMGAESLRTWRRLAEEYDSEDRIYCSKAPCSAFIPRRFIVETLDAAICPACFAETCIKCKQAGHVGDCPIDEGLEKTRQLASDSGWRACSNCARLVEKNGGCHHMRYETPELGLTSKC